MEREDFVRLLSPAGQRLLATVDYDSRSDVLGLVSQLRARGEDPLLVAAVLTQAKLRKKAAAKFGDFASRMLFTEAGLEQATRLKVAAIHAGRFRSAGIGQVADLGCGIGAEAMAMAAIGIEVRAFEVDELTAAIATYNLSPFENVTVELADVKELDLSSFEALFFDPARRNPNARGKSGYQRIFDPSDYSPDFDFCVSKAKTKPTGMKLGPAHDKKAIPEKAEAQWVSVDGDLVELSLWFGSVKREGVSRSALLFNKDTIHEIHSGDFESEKVSVGELGDFIFEPDASMIRSGLMAEIAKENDCQLISPEIAYLTSNHQIRSPWLAGYQIEDNLPFDRKKLKAYLRERSIGIVEIKKRGADISPEALRKELALKGEGAATLIVTRVGDAHRVLVTQPITD